MLCARLVRLFVHDSCEQQISARHHQTSHRTVSADAERPNAEQTTKINKYFNQKCSDMIQ